MPVIIIKQLGHCFTTKHFLKNTSLLDLCVGLTLNYLSMIFWFSCFWTIFHHILIHHNFFSLSWSLSFALCFPLMINCYRVPVIIEEIESPYQNSQSPSRWTENTSPRGQYSEFTQCFTVSYVLLQALNPGLALDFMFWSISSWKQCNDMIQYHGEPIILEKCGHNVISDCNKYWCRISIKFVILLTLEWSTSR